LLLGFRGVEFIPNSMRVWFPVAFDRRRRGPVSVVKRGLVVINWLNIPSLNN
jgi:hypothetical protein